MIFAYTRVSTIDQNAERQRVAIDAYAKTNHITIDRFYKDAKSGKDFNRPAYQALKTNLRAGDILIIKELDRISRNMNQMKQEWLDLQNMGVEIIVTDTPLLNTANKNDLEKSLISNIVFELLAYMAEKERQKILTRQAEGIAIAKAQGKYTGRKKLTRDNFDAVYSDWKAGKITGVEAARSVHLSKSTFYRRVKQRETKE